MRTLPILNGKYQLVAIIGQGGFGQVFRAIDLHLKREVAVKLLKPQVSSNESVAARFLSEARLTSRLTHPNTLTVHDFGQHNGRLFLVSELLYGETLRERLDKNYVLKPHELVSYFVPVCKALHEAHSVGIIHRDLKPDNLFLHKVFEEERMVLLDFGIAKSMEDLHITKTGQVFGTPHYMAPEQIKTTKNVTPLADIYSLGVIFYESLSGVEPYQGDSAFELFDQHVRAEIPTLVNSVSPILAPLDQLIQAMLAKDPRARPQDMIEVAQRLETIVSGLPKNIDTIDLISNEQLLKIKTLQSHRRSSLESLAAETEEGLGAIAEILESQLTSPDPPDIVERDIKRDINEDFTINPEDLAETIAPTADGDIAPLPRYLQRRALSSVDTSSESLALTMDPAESQLDEVLYETLVPSKHDESELKPEPVSESISKPALALEPKSKPELAPEPEPEQVFKPESKVEPNLNTPHVSQSDHTHRPDQAHHSSRGWAIKLMMGIGLVGVGWWVTHRSNDSTPTPHIAPAHDSISKPRVADAEKSDEISNDLPADTARSTGKRDQPKPDSTTERTSEPSSLTVVKSPQVHPTPQNTDELTKPKEESKPTEDSKPKPKRVKLYLKSRASFSVGERVKVRATPVDESGQRVKARVRYVIRPARVAKVRRGFIHFKQSGEATIKACVKSGDRSLCSPKRTLYVIDPF